MPFPPGKIPIGVFLPDLIHIDAWVGRGCNFGIFADRLYDGKTWEELHGRIVPKLRAAGKMFGVMRPPAFVIGKPPEFDRQYRDQLIAFALNDELEDDQIGADGRKLNMPRDAALIGPKILAIIKQYRDYDGVPIYVN